MIAEPVSEDASVVSSGIIFDVSPSPPGATGAALSPDIPADGQLARHRVRLPGEVLVDRIAAGVAQHEPGWRLPRPSALARRYGSTPRDISVAIEELIARHLVRRLPDGQLYRSSPAEYLVALEGMSGLGTRLDPMGGEVSCRRLRLSRRVVPADVCWTLKTPPGEPVSILQLEWASNGEPAAVSTTYLAAHLAQSSIWVAQSPADPELVLRALTPFAGGAADQGSQTQVPCRPSAAAVEVQPASPSIARTLRLAPGAPALTVTIRFDDIRLSRPAAITVAVLRAEMFRVALEWAERAG